jgi:protocatechuate 3,4-dioxygenase beta subunit
MTTSAGSSGGVAVAGSSAAAGGGAITLVTGWATGGTKAMQGNYPDPFTGSMMSSSCTLYPAQTIGPCYAKSPMMREDISDGLDGLPIRLSFLVVHASGCAPVAGASIDIWHSGSDGIYSAYDTGTTCNPGMMNVKSMMFCRGVQSTDETGRANFSSVFPGWYKGRTIHIHFTVRISGKEYITSQLYFDDMLTDDILAQGTYKSRGKRDTTNNTDGLFKSGGAKPDQVLFETAKRADGVLHAWKVLSIS